MMINKHTKRRKYAECTTHNENQARMQFQLQEAANKSGMLFASFSPNGKAVSEIAPPMRGKAIYSPQQLRARVHWPLCLATGGRVFVAVPSTLGRHVCYVCKRSVCGGDEPQPVAHLSHKLQCARQSLKIMVSYGNKYPRHKNAATRG